MGSGLRRTVAALGLLLAIVWVGLDAASASAYQSSVWVSGTPGGHRLPPGFLGIAIEFGTVSSWEPGGTAPPNPVLAQLVKNLNPVGQPSIRIGGESTDRSWWPTPGVPRPLGVTQTIGLSWAQTLQKLAVSTNAKLLLGLNLEANRPKIAEYEADEYDKLLGKRYIGAFEVGNEPDLYPLIPWYRVVNGKPYPWYYKGGGTPVYSRRPTYGPSQFAQELSRTVDLLPKLPEAGPETGHGPWLQAFTDVVRPRGVPMTLTSHAYGLNQCVNDPASRVYPTVPNLLTQFASRDNLLPGDGPFISLAHLDGGSYRIDEMGSVTCNGRAGVSNTMASALWALDALFYVDSQGVDGVNLHSYPGSTNGLFDFTHPGGVWGATVHPLYYGALMFAQAAPEGSRLLPVRGAAPSQLRAWATLGSDGQVRVLLINDSLDSSGRIVVHSPAGWGSKPGALEGLVASSAYATSGIRLGGQSFAPASNGVLAAPTPLTTPPQGGAYTVTMAPATAALLTLSPRQ